MIAPLRFHWSLSAVGDAFRRTLPVEHQSGAVLIDQYTEFSHLAECNGIDSLLMAIGSSRPDPTVLSVALAAATTRIKFLVACRSGLISPAYFVQQINTLGSLTEGRVHINMVLGHTPAELRYYGDFLSHNERAQRTDEFLSICSAYWSGNAPVDFDGRYYRVVAGRIRTPFRGADRNRPEIYMGGSSHGVVELAARHADCLWRIPDDLHSIQLTAQGLGEAALGMLVSLITRPTHREAWAAAEALVRRFDESAVNAQKRFRDRSDSEGFRGAYDRAIQSSANAAAPCLWSGAVPYLGAPSVALVGSFEEICDAIFVYRSAGVRQFLFMGWPDSNEVEYFGQGVLPLIRARERSLAQCA